MYLQMPWLCLCGNSRVGWPIASWTKLQCIPPTTTPTHTQPALLLHPSAKAGEAPNERGVREREKGGGSWRVSEWRRLKGWKREKNGGGAGGGGVTAED